VEVIPKSLSAAAHAQVPGKTPSKGEMEPALTILSSTAPTAVGLGMPRTINPIPEGARTPVKSDQAMAWPSIVKDFSPSNLKRTASHLMNEWEKSLLPSSPGTPTSEGQGREDAMAALEGRSRPSAKVD
jgi:hypothetical protein